MRCKWIFSLLFFPLFLFGLQEESRLPFTDEEIAQFMEQAKVHALETVAQVKALSADQRTSANTMNPLNQLVNDLMGYFSVLMYLQYIGQKETDKEVQELMLFLSRAVLQDRVLVSALLTYAESALDGKTPLSPYVHYQIQCLLKSCESIKNDLTAQEQYRLERLTVENVAYEQTPFFYLKGQGTEKACALAFPEDGVSVFSLNTCFIPHRYPILFGGVFLPWQQRIAPLAERILSVDADVVCLQEVHAEAASYALYQALQHRYTHFYGAIGPRLFGFSLNALGLPSGLFIASKYPLEKPRFTPFPVSGFAMNYGFFDCIIPHRAHLYMTHMQSLDLLPQFAQIRCAQLKLIVDTMQADCKEEDIPSFLCGDLNVPFGSNEPSEALIRTYFIDAYNRDQATVGENNNTCTYYFTNHYFAADKSSDKIDPQYQILDYALLLKSANFSLRTTRICMNDQSQPREAISDHHALLTTISK